jgi:DNA-binding winged helix-turn-helix (wHTH) protein
MPWHFGPFRLDLTAVCLWRGEQPVPLRPKTLAVLAYLVTHAEELVTKEALEAVWPETAVGDGVLKTSLHELRKALGETAKAPQWIATVHGRGYRFVAPVTGSESTAPPHAAAPSPHAAPASPPQRTIPPERAPLAALLTPLAAQSRPPAPLESERKQVTVLFADLTDSLVLIRDLDPEAAQQLLDPALHAMMDAVHRYGGTINQVLGDGVMALFGAPLAHEDHTPSGPATPPWPCRRRSVPMLRTCVAPTV